MPLNLTVRINEDGVPVLAQAREAIASVESAGSGGYKAIGPKTKSGDRAYGRYQVMGRNIPAWTKEVFGKSMTPQEFLASPEAQDAVFNHVFGGNIEKYGPEGAARAWFTGSPTGRGRDILGTSAEQYVNKFNAALGGSVNPTPQFTQGRFGGMPVPESPVIPVGDVVRGPWGLNRVPAERKGIVGESAGGGGMGNFGSKWRTQEGISQYEAQAGLRPGTLEPVARPPASIREHPRLTEAKQFEAADRLETLRIIKPSDAIPKGKVVDMHPATDRWMMGDKMARVLGKDKNGNFKVEFLVSGKKGTVRPEDILRPRSEVQAATSSAVPSQTSSTSWLYSKEAASLNLPDRLARALQENPAMRPSLQKWAEGLEYFKGDQATVLQGMRNLSDMLKGFGF